MATGFIWYHPKVFGKAWMDSLGLTEEDLNKGNMAKIFGISFVMAVLLAVFLLPNTNGPGQEGVYDTFKHGAAHGLILGIMVALPVMISNGLFERKSWKNMIINGAYWVLTLCLMGGVIDAMNHWPVDMAPM
jgi:hypothetical protein